MYRENEVIFAPKIKFESQSLLLDLPMPFFEIQKDKLNNSILTKIRDGK